MEYFFDQYDYTEEEILWFNEPIPALKQSAFVKYVGKPSQEYVINDPRRIPRSDHRNMNKRMIEFLKRNLVARPGDSERERGRRHMISERIRREKQKNSYLSLHSILPPGTKNDKNSIVKVAAKEVEELRCRMEELKSQNYELNCKVLDARKSGEETEERSTIKLRVAYPKSGIDSMLGVLKCLKDTGSNTTSIHSKVSAHEFSAVLDIKTKMKAAEVEKAVNRSLYEAERKFQLYYPQR